MRTLGNLLAVAVPLGLIGFGFWMIYPPASMVVVGFLIWHDLRGVGGVSR